MRGSGHSPGQAEEAIKPSAFGVLSVELRRAEAQYLDVKSLLSRGVAARGLEDAHNAAAVLCSRIATVVALDAADVVGECSFVVLTRRGWIAECQRMAASVTSSGCRIR